MASSTRHLCRSLRQLTKNPSGRSRAIRYHSPTTLRPFSSVSTRRADTPVTNSSRPSLSSTAQSTGGTGRSADVLDETEYLKPQKPYTPADLSPSERADYDLLSPSDQKQYLRLQNHFKAIFESPESQEELDAMVDRADKEIDREGGEQVRVDFPSARAKGQEIGYWAEDEEDEMGQMEDADDEWSAENITIVAESELDLHRDIREYTRIAAWDLPLLQQYAKPFTPPNHFTPLRFRYTTYMGEHHPAQHKVVVELCSKDLLSHPSSTYKLSESQRTKLLKLVGVRYNPDTDVIKMSCEKFGSAAQNKRYLGELVGKLLKEAKDKRDMFEDIALDFRHHKPKKVVPYPEEWKLSGQTVPKVLGVRQEIKLLAGEEDAIPVDGSKVVESYIRAGNLRPASLLSR